MEQPSDWDKNNHERKLFVMIEEFEPYYATDRKKFEIPLKFKKELIAWLEARMKEAP